MTRIRIYLLFLAILIISIGLKVYTLQEYMNKPLVWDANQYKTLAENIKSPFDTAWREPVFVWFVKGTFTIFGSSALNLKLMTMALSIGCLVLLFFMARDLFNDFVALFATFLYALNPYLHYSSVRGLRHELFTIFVLIFVWFLLKPRGNPQFRIHRHGQLFPSLSSALRNSIWLGLIAGVGLLTATILSTFIFPAIIYIGIRRKWHIIHIALPLLLSLIIVSPLLIHQKVLYNDPFYYVNMLGHWYCTYEFTGLHEATAIKPEFLPHPKISAFDYVFKLHTPKEILMRSIKGFWQIYIGELHARIFLNNVIIRDLLKFPRLVLFLVLFYLLGILWISRFTSQVNGLDFLVLFLFAAAPLSFLVTIPGGLDSRIIIHIAPFTVCITAVGVWKSAEYIHELLHRHSTILDKNEPYTR